MLTFWVLFLAFPANVVLVDAEERSFVGKKVFCIPEGVMVLRSENIVLLGQIDAEMDEAAMPRTSQEENERGIESEEKNLNDSRIWSIQ